MNATDRNSADFDLPLVKRRTLDYCIASTPHSGSGLLGDALWAAESAGAPHEYFRRGQMAGFAERWGVGTIDAYVVALRKHRTADSGVFGFSAHYHQFEDQIGADLMTAHFEGIRPILLRRRDTLGQAVEWSEAAQRERKRLGDEEQGQPRFDPKLIDDLEQQITFEERSWRRYFQSTGVVPHEVVYEDLLADFAGTVREVFSFLDLEPPQHIEVPREVSEAPKLIQLWAWRCRRGAVRTKRGAQAMLPPLAVGTLPPPTRLRIPQRSERQA